jgi:hypothetical protein
LSFLIAILTLALVAVVVLVVSAPVRARRRPADPGGRSPDSLSANAATVSGSSSGAAEERLAAREELEAAREAKYREIRDVELDYRTGKLSRDDYRAIDGELRAEALEILNRLEANEP